VITRAAIRERSGLSAVALGLAVLAADETWSEVLGADELEVEPGVELGVEVEVELGVELGADDMGTTLGATGVKPRQPSTGDPLTSPKPSPLPIEIALIVMVSG